MATRSILDYEEAQRRLQQLAQDQTTLVQLVSKLRNFCDETEARMQAIADREQRMDAHLAETKEQADSYRTALHELRQAKEQLHQGFEETRVAVTESTQQLHDWVESDQSAWRDQLQQEFKTFAEQHHADLETVARAYDRHRVVFDNLKISTEALESSLEDLSKSTKEQIQTVRAEATRKIAAMADEASDKLDAVRKGAELLVQERYASLGKSLGDRTQAASEAIDALESDVANSKTRFRSQVFLLWVAVAVLLLAFVFKFAVVDNLPREKPGSTQPRPANDRASQNEPLPAPPWSSGASENADTGGEAAARKLREWTNRHGRTIEATFNGFDQEHGQVRLGKSDGNEYSVPLEELSDSDQEYILKFLP